MVEMTCVCGESINNSNVFDATCGDCSRKERVPTEWWIRSEKELEEIEERGGSARFPWKG